MTSIPRRWPIAALAVAVIAAYLSSFLAAMMSVGAGYAIIPNLQISSKLEGVQKLPDVAFELDLPQIFPVMSALVLSVLLGLACVWINSQTISHFLQEFQMIVLEIVKRVIIRCLKLSLNI